MKIERTGSRDVFALPVSYSQERLWFLERLEPNTPLYNIPYMATLKGGIHRNAFNKAVNRLIARHESLRTCFIEHAGKPRQAIYPRLSVEVDSVDISDSNDRAATEKLQAICTEVVSTPFDLSEAPLFRITLVASRGETTIITTIHHIIADGWSLGVFQRELSALYQEELGGRSAALPELRVQYADYAAWQREQLMGESLDRLKQFWARELAGAPTILELPGDHPRPAKQTHRGDVHLFDLGPDSTASIKALAGREEVTLFMALFAVFGVLLYRLTGYRDVLVGTPIAGRKGADVENLIGLFVNTLVLRARMDPEQSFLRLLADVKATTLGAFEHQDIPFEKLVLELNPKRDLSRNPLIQVLFTLQNIPPLQAVIAGATEAPVGISQNLDGHTGTAKFDFALFVSENGNKLQCSVEFNTDLFELATIVEIGQQFTMVLERVLADPEASLRSYSLLGQAQRREVLAAARGPSRRSELEGLGCHQLFERQCQRTPNATAIAHVSASTHSSAASGRTSECLSYAELNARANRIARHLLARGVRPRDNVAICMPRSIDQIATLLAIVKAGAAYVPLDPDYPLDRLRYILSNVGAKALIRSVSTKVSLDQFVEVVTLEHDAEAIAALSDANLDLDCSPHTPLYVIHTSGSTGRPKGVVMPHRSIVNLIEWQARASSAGPGAVTLQYASLNFDVASQEVFTTLTGGGCLQVIDEQVRRDSSLLLDHLDATRAHRVFLPPVALEQLASAASGKDGTLADLREVIVAGDKLQVTDKVRELFGRLPGACLVNQYGPTESHVVSAHTLTGPVAEWPTHPSIGKPIDNVQLYVLDEWLEPVPPRVAGDLYIGGVALSLGYLDLPDETRSRFVADPFEAGGVLYKTGDVCRYERDGTLTFNGRADHQIKLRGFRIEPGEIEVILKRHEAIEDAVVVKRSSAHHEDQLVAYISGPASAAPSRTDLRAYLADELPAYMIPTHFVALEAFPLTGSGKIDRLALPDPAEVESAVDDKERELVAPRTPIEQTLVECFRTVLGVDEVSITDNFFELGGHSLTATQLVSRIRDEFAVELPLFRVFERSTPELLALEITFRHAAQQEQSELDSLLAELESLSEEETSALLSASAGSE